MSVKRRQMSVRKRKSKLKLTNRTRRLTRKKQPKEVPANSPLRNSQTLLHI